MRDPFNDLMNMHNAAAPHGCALSPELLSYVQSRAEREAALRNTPNVVVLNQPRAHSGPVEQVTDDQISNDPRLLRFPTPDAGPLDT